MSRRETSRKLPESPLPTKRYRVLAWQPLAVPVDGDIPQPFRVYLDEEFPRLSFQPLPTAGEDAENAGCLICCEFETDDSDLLKALQLGMGIIDGALACFAVSSGLPARPSVPRELAEITPDVEERRFLTILAVDPPNIAPHKISQGDLDFLRRAALHWRGLDSGRRLRRATQRFAQAMGESDDLSAYQCAYQGLEALEKPLALEAGLTPGSEIVKGKCDHCQHEFERKRTALVGVRALVCGDLHDVRSPASEQEWKRLSGLRTDLVHGLEDSATVEGQAHDLLPAAMHHLHNACAHLAHAHELETGAFKMYLNRPKLYVARGTYTGKVAGRFIPLLTAGKPRWVQHGAHKVPEFAVHREGGEDVSAQHLELNKPLPVATEADLTPVRVAPPPDESQPRPRRKTPKNSKRAEQKRARKKNRGR